MTMGSASFTVTSLLAAAAEVLEGASFETVAPSKTGYWRATAARVYEDAYSIVCVTVYETWGELSSRWVEDQANLVDLISKHFGRNDAKAWDGYLVLLTPSVVPSHERLRAISIQRNTLHVRKLFADGDELGSIGDVRRVLLPLLPLLPLEKHYGDEESPNVLGTLPSLLSEHGVDEEAAHVAIASFREQRSIIADVHELMTKRKGNQS